MKRIVLLLLASTLLCSTGCRTADHDFDSVVRGVEHRYSVHAQIMRLMGFASFCAHVTTQGGVKGMRIAEFQNIRNIDPVELSSMLQFRLGDQWQPFVTDLKMKDGNSDGEASVIFVRPDGHFMRMLIADYNHGELDVIRMELNGAALAKWMQNPESNGWHIANNAQPRRQTD